MDTTTATTATATIITEPAPAVYGGGHYVSIVRIGRRDHVVPGLRGSRLAAEDAARALARSLGAQVARVRHARAAS